MVTHRFGQVIGIHPETVAEYKKYHAALWPDLVPLLKNAGLSNYSIYWKDRQLFGYFEYRGADFKADMAKLASNARVREWWAIMEPMQEPVSTRLAGEWWANMEEVFHFE